MIIKKYNLDKKFPLYLFLESKENEITDEPRMKEEQPSQNYMNINPNDWYYRDITW